MIESVRKIGIVTVTYNSEGVIDDFMKSALNQDFTNFQLYIVDNASSDGTLRRLDSYRDPRVVRIENPDNRGVAEGNNQGILQANADHCTHVLLINNDTTFGESLLNTLMGSMEKLGADMLVPKMMYFEPNDRIWCAGGGFRRWRAYGIVHYGDGEVDRGQFEVARQVRYAPTCCMLIKSEVFDRVGLMDALYFVYYDDVDFCYRAWKSGITLWYCPIGVLHHKVGSLTGGLVSGFAIRYGTRNKVYFILKHMGRMPSKVWLVLYQGLFVARLLFKRDTLKIYKMKRSAYAEGLALHRKWADLQGRQ